jgi:hypothetical protein
MRNKAQVLLNDEMASYLIEQFDKGSIIYTSESIVLENGELVNRITFDGCDIHLSATTFFTREHYSINKHLKI